MFTSVHGHKTNVKFTLNGQTYYFVLETDDIVHNAWIPAGYGGQKIVFVLQQYG